MGNINSGRYYRERRLTTAEVTSIDVREIFRLPRFPYLWLPCPAQNKKYYFPIEYKATDEQVTFGAQTGNNIQVINKVSISWSKRNFGGKQPYFICPDNSCGKPVAILYITDKIACRTCSNLAYESQHETKYIRLMRRAKKCRKRIGAQPILLSPIPDKPKGMHHQTYEHAVYMINALEIEAINSMKSYLSDKWVKKLEYLDQILYR